MLYFFSCGSYHHRQAVQVRRQDQGPRATNLRGYILSCLWILEHYPLPIRPGTANCTIIAQFPIENHSEQGQSAELPLKTIGESAKFGRLLCNSL
jgi:hypothetical protein